MSWSARLGRQVVLAAVLLFAIAASSQTVFTSRAAFAGDQTFDWIALGATSPTTTGLSVPNPFPAVTSATGLVTISGVQPQGGFARVDEGANWFGNFTTGDHLLSTNGSAGPVTITFASGPVYGAGMQLQMKPLGPFTGVLTAYDSTGAVIATATVAGTSTSPTTADNSAPFIGLRTTLPEIAKIQLSCLVSGARGNLMEPFAMNQISVALQPATATPPLAPSAVTATAGQTTATVSWTPTANGQPTTSYVVRTLLAPTTAGGAAGPSTVPDVTVLASQAGGAVPTTTTVPGLTSGTAYEFEVQACNSSGCSAFSAPSNAVTPLALSAPSAPTGVTAVAGAGSATVTWTLGFNGNSAITSSTVSAFDSASPTLPATTLVAAGPVSSAVVNGLLGGHSYTFTVHSTNAIGSSPESAASAPVTIPQAAVSADVSVSMTAAATANAGSVLTYSLKVSNAGPGSVAQVTLSDNLPAPLSSSTTTQGTCAGAPGGVTFSCNLGTMAAGASATVTVSVQLPTTATGTVSNTASVSAADALGAPVPDPNAANNVASVSTTINAPAPAPPPPPPAPTCTATTTDLQTVGSAQNGGPALGSLDTFTWQIKNNQGNTSANCAQFTSTLPANFAVSAVSSTQGTCSAVGNTISCSLGTINGGTTAIVTVEVNVGTTAGTFSTAGSASFTGTDTNPQNDQFTVTIQPK